MSGLGAQEWQRSYDVVTRLRSYMGGRGYQTIDTPLLEETELFVRKAGGDLSGRLYNFTDPGGTAVSLRPEFTSSVIRHFVDSEASLSLPVRWQYSGPVFRYEPENRGSYRQFTQSGAELVGACGNDADIEIIALAAGGLQELGIDGFRLRVGHLGALHSLLDAFELSEAAKLFIIGNMDELRAGAADVGSLLEHAAEVGLLSGSVDLGVDIGVALESMSAEAAEEFIYGVLKESMPEPLGRRTTDHIIARLLSKVRQANCPQAFESALMLAHGISGISGAPSASLQSARNAARQSGIEDEPLDAVESLLGRLRDIGIAESGVELDLGMARGISYYTGVIFELVSDESETLGGGGRYDGLVQALGGSGSVPAMGFAFNVNVLLDTLAAGGVQANGA